MKKQLYIIALIAIILGACEDFLEKKPLAQETTDTFLGSPATAEANFEQMLVACYSTFTLTENTWRNNKHYFENMISDWMSDDCEKGGNGLSDMPEMLDMRAWAALPSPTTTAHYSTPWLEGYLGSGRANAVLDLVEDYKGNLSTESYNRIKGEALFLRAYFYYILARSYGNVPYFDKPVTANEYYDQAKVSPEKLYELIEKDLADAVDLVPEKSNWDDIWPGGRATRGAVRAILARIITMEIGFGFNGKVWQDVYDVTKVIINSNEYSLLSDYATIFENEGEMGSESVFEVPCADLGGGYGSLGGNMEQRMVTLRPSTSLTYGPNTPTGGWGFSNPTQNLFDQFEPGDVRRECTIIKDGDIFMGDVIPTIVDDQCPTGYWFRKYAGPDPRQNTSGDKNNRIVRYAEVLLTHAEAAWHIGQEAEALQTLNVVRDRARASTDPNNGNVSTLGPITATSGQALLDAIKHERRVELAIEGLRAWDLIRWGEFENALRTVIIPTDRFLGSMDPEQAVQNYRSHLIDGKVPCLPIPSDEVESYRIKQNPGY
ncbi:MAG: RagB/SusD family nutrient uptake outer membrane protein [Bacteroidales bacterium]|nr:RagB/SusD family nutrient uptake outer membrane protein [Bacteroidales bacterium]